MDTDPLGSIISPLETPLERFLHKMPRKTFETSLAGKKKFFFEAIHSMPSSERPPAGTSIWMWGRPARDGKAVIHPRYEVAKLRQFERLENQD